MRGLPGAGQVGRLPLQPRHQVLHEEGGGLALLLLHRGQGAGGMQDAVGDGGVVDILVRPRAQNLTPVRQDAARQQRHQKVRHVQQEDAARQEGREAKGPLRVQVHEGRNGRAGCW